MELMRELAMGILVMGLTLGTVIAWVILLNARDRRAAVALNTVAGHLGADLRGLISIQVHCGLLSRKCLVRLDTWALSSEEIVRLLDRVSHALPPHVRLTADGMAGAGSPVAFTVEWQGGRAQPPARRSLALG